MAKPAIIKMISAVTVPTVSNTFVNNKCDACLLQITGTFASATVSVEGIVDVNSGSWVSLATFNLTDLDIKTAGMTAKSIYQVGITGILRVRVNVTAVYGGNITVVANFVGTSWSGEELPPSSEVPFTAYDEAVLGGYTGTKEAFDAGLANVLNMGPLVQQAQNSANSAATSANQASTAANNAAGSANSAVTSANAAATAANNAAGAAGNAISSANAAASSAVEAANAAATAAEDALNEIAPELVREWLDENVDPVGSAVIVDSSLTISGAAADAKTTGDEISNVKSVISVIDTITVGSWTDGMSYLTPSATSSMQTNGMTATNGFSCGYLPCATGDTFYLTGTGGSGAKLWVWTKLNGTIISRAASNATENNLELIAPYDAAYLLYNSETSSTHYIIKGTNINQRISALNFKNLQDLYKVETGTEYGTTVNLLDVLAKVPNKDMNLATFNSTTVFNYKSLATSSNISYLTEPLRIRDNDGNLIANILCSYSDNIGAAAIGFGYKADGAPDRRYKAEDVTNGVLTFDSTTYYVVFVKYNSVSLLDLRVIVEKNEYYVGTGQEYTTLHDCFTALKDDTHIKTIHVMGGTYDIYQELGGSAFISSLTGNENWYDVNDIIPSNTTLIGHGNVIIKMELPSTTSNEVASLLSPLNMMGSAKLKNLSITAANCRYCIHPEGEKMEQYNNAVWEIEDCYITKTDVTVGTTAAIACGLNEGVFFKLKNCVIKSVGNIAFSMHDNSAIYNTSPRVVFDACVLDAPYYPIVFSCTYRTNMQTVIKVLVTNCYAPQFMRKRTSQTYAKDCYEVTYVNTPHRTQNASEVTDIIADINYNNFA